MRKDPSMRLGAGKRERRKGVRLLVRVVREVIC